jgi:hypothetical protein
MKDKESLLRIKEFIDQTRDKMTITSIRSRREVETDRGVFVSEMETEIESSETKPENLRDAQIAYLLLSMETSIGAWKSALSESAITVTTFETKVKDLKKNTMAHLSRLIPKEEEKEKIA